MTKKRPVLDWSFGLVAALSLGAATFVYVKHGWAVFIEILLEDITMFFTVLPKVAAGCLIGALVRLLVPRETIVRWVGEGSGITGLVIAAFVGAIFPGGPFTIFPLAGAFLLSGADRGAAVSFVTGWLLLGINRAIIWEMPYFGTETVAIRFGLTLGFPIMAGLMARWLDRLIETKKRST